MANKFEAYKEIEKIINYSLNVRTISEELICFEQDTSPEVVRQYLIENRFDLVGVKQSGNVVGFTNLETLKKSEIRLAYNEFKPNDIVSSNTPLVETVTLINQKKYLFVLDGTSITRIVTKADIYKEPVRLFLYNLISNFETLLSILIEYYYPNSEWESIISPKNLQKTHIIHKARIRENTDFDLFDCLSLELKIELFLKKDDLKGIIGMSGTKHKEFFKELKDVRNAISHVGKNPAIANTDKILYMITTTTHYSNLFAEGIQRLKIFEGEIA